MANAIWADVEAVVENRVKEQLERHLLVDPNADPKKIIELQMKHEKVRLETRLRKLEESADSDETRELALRYLIDDFLPKLEKKLKSKRL